MMSESTYFGSYERAVDPKGRFNLPFKLRRGAKAAKDDGFVITKGPDGSLNLMPRDAFVAAFDKVAQTGEAGRDKRMVLRGLSKVSQLIVPDSQGRVAVPNELLQTVGVTGRVLCIGMGHYIELWDPERYAIVEATLGAPASAHLDTFFG